MWLLFFKAMHIIGAVAWFAGLFYLVRIFVYHTEAFDKAEPEKSVLIKQYNIMEWRAYKIICNPAMILTFSFGTVMLFYNPVYLEMPWLHVKLTLLVLLAAYHHYCKVLITKLEKGSAGLSSFQFRLFNEVPTLFLFSIVLLAVLKNNANFIYIFGGILVLGIVLYLITKMYKRIREKK